MSERELLMRACIDNPLDRQAKLVFADWCDENGEPLAAIALRWMAKHGKRPFRSENFKQWKWYALGLDQKGWQNPRGRRMPFTHCWIPEIVGRELSKCYPRSSRQWFVLVRRTGWALQRIRDLVD